MATMRAAVCRAYGPPDVVRIEQVARPEPKNDEVLIRILASTVSSGDFGLVDTIADHFDEPFADASALPTYRVCELAREEVTVALSGDGADEAFAGYRRLVFQHQEERLRGLIPDGMHARIHVTLTDDYPYAQAFVVIEALSPAQIPAHEARAGLKPMA